jgi:3',5'-cyclic AMP phosphodiesterase CpdA
MTHHADSRTPIERPGISRRDLLRGASVAGVAAVGVGALARPARAHDAPARLLRIAHLTDMHVQPEKRAEEGFVKSLEHAASAKPDVIVTGGDLIMDAFNAGKARTSEQWDIYLRACAIVKDIPIRHCLGNHDIWGWGKAKSGTKGDEAGWGKKWAIDVLSLSGAYYSFTQGSCKVIVLDSVREHNDDAYAGGLDDAQFEWLKGELAATAKTTPVVVVSHIPIMHASTALLDVIVDKDGSRWGVGLTFRDARRVTNLLARYPNVRAALSGHIHVLERIDYDNIAYINSGAVSGAWWNSQERARAERSADTRDALTTKPLRANPGYALVDVMGDASVKWQYVEYGWQGA